MWPACCSCAGCSRTSSLPHQIDGQPTALLRNLLPPPPWTMSDTVNATNLECKPQQRVAPHPDRRMRSLTRYCYVLGVCTRCARAGEAGAGRPEPRPRPPRARITIYHSGNMNTAVRENANTDYGSECPLPDERLTERASFAHAVGRTGPAHTCFKCAGRRARAKFPFRSLRFPLPWSGCYYM